MTVRQTHSLTRQNVNVRCFDATSKAAHISPTGVIEQENQKIWTLTTLGSRAEGTADQQRKQRANSKSDHEALNEKSFRAWGSANEVGTECL
jgi:hypothetical protein